ncbi:MGMT family protein [Alteromonas sp. CYL-A6]|uniref:MGMT family protein n=1 Tax=Alteromonas nitratireducens TaxID=3390813 RepID=UPI0034BBE402
MPKQDPCYQIKQTLKLVPAGHVVGYGQLADYAGLPGRARLVGRCLRQAGEPDLPWHRVVRANGQIAFAPGSNAAEEQRARLTAEGVVVMHYRVAMSRFAWQPRLDELLGVLRY